LRERQGGKTRQTKRKNRKEILTSHRQRKKNGTNAAKHPRGEKGRLTKKKLEKRERNTMASRTHQKEGSQKLLLFSITKRGEKVRGEKRVGRRRSERGFVAGGKKKNVLGFFPARKNEKN